MSGQPTPPRMTEAFAVDAGGSFITSPFPIPSQIGITDGAASLHDGFPPLTMTALGAGGIPPSGPDMNGILFLISAHTAYVAAGQPYYFDATLAAAMGGYAVGAVVQRADAHGYWINRLDANTNDPDAPGSIAPGSGWFPGFQIGVSPVPLTGSNYTLQPDDYGKPVLSFTGALTADIQVTFPNITQQWIVINNTTGAHSITAVGTALGAIVVPQSGPTGSMSLFTIGDTSVYTNSISTAGLAPLASPHLTGTPTAPTGTLHANTTQIATQAFVIAEITADLTGYALLASPTFSGVPTVPTPALNDNSAKIASTAFVQAALGQGATLGVSGQQVFKSGLIIKWGKTGPASPGNPPFTVTFPTPFPTACLNVQLTSVPSDGTVAVNSVAAASFVMQQGASGVSTYWLAIGF